MSSTVSAQKRDTSQRLLGTFSLVIGGMGLIKFLGFVVMFGPGKSPWLYLLVFVLPFLVGWPLLRSRPRFAAVLIGTAAALFGALCIGVVVTGTIEPYWPDYVLVFVAGPLALAAV